MENYIEEKDKKLNKLKIELPYNLVTKRVNIEIQKRNLFLLFSLTIIILFTSQVYNLSLHGAKKDTSRIILSEAYDKSHMMNLEYILNSSILVKLYKGLSEQLNFNLRIESTPMISKEDNKKQDLSGLESNHKLTYMTICYVIFFFIYGVYNLIIARKKKTNKNKEQFIHSLIILMSLFYISIFISLLTKVTTISVIFIIIGFPLLLVALHYTYCWTFKKMIAKKELEKPSKEEKNTIKKLEKELLIKQKEEGAKERKRISNELQNGILSELFCNCMTPNLRGFTVNQRRERYQDFLNKLHQVEKEIRELPDKLSLNLEEDEIDFERIIDRLFIEENFSITFDYKLDIDKSISWKNYREVDLVNVYRIIQEAIQNIIKHALAKKVLITIKKNNKSVRIEIKDDGVGFDISKLEISKGIDSIKSRAKRLNGFIEIISKVKEGTSLSIDIPYVFSEVQAMV
ncbi:sensor histidine kinase [Tenacibaculum sp. C7A-26P2]|uniref:sensor histidine kinase n=1 Tax=Tenacibaculum sp. C7A-26P2 TaxID=3447504 RepID=UPI003F84DFBA